MKILLSWMAYTHDFIQSENGGKRVNPNGTHGELYSHLIGGYNKHYLLSSNDQDDRVANRSFRQLKDHLEMRLEDITESVELMPIYLSVNPIDLADIKTHLEELLIDIYKSYPNATIEVFVSPGTPSMFTVWYLLAETYRLSLFQIAPPEKRDDNEYKPIFIKVLKGSFAKANSIVHRSFEKKQPFIAKSISRANDLADKIAATYNTTTLILGESGTGKELIARRIHKNSHRRNHVFIAINCSALSDQLLESRLFGYMKNAFTGAHETTNGLFQKADGGTFFLDEIGDITAKMQQTLLRVLQEKSVTKIGSGVPDPVNVHVICATRKDLWEMAQDDTFRLDLYYRINVATIELSPVWQYSIDERKKLINYFLELVSLETFPEQGFDMGYEKKHLSNEAMSCLLKYKWPGNIREVENLVKRFYAFVDGRTIELRDIPKRIREPEGTAASLLLEDVIKAHETKVLLMVNNKKTEAARILGIDPRTIKTQ